MSRCTAAVWSGQTSVFGADVPKMCGNRGPRCHLHRDGGRYCNAPEFAEQVRFTTSLCGIRMRRFNVLEHEARCKACLRRFRWNNKVRIARESAGGAE